MEKVNELIEQLVKEKIENIDFEEMAEEILDKKITHYIKEHLELPIRQNVNKYVEQECKKIFSEPIFTDNGWGTRKTYDSFESFFKQVFREKMDKDWEMKREIQRITENHMDELFKKNRDTVLKKYNEVLMAELLIEGKEVKK